MSDEFRLFVALGPGDIVGARRSQLARNAINETSIPSSEQLFAYCRLRGSRTLARPPMAAPRCFDISQESVYLTNLPD